MPRALTIGLGIAGAGLVQVLVAARPASGADELSPGDVAALLETSSLLVIDVRTPREYERGHLPGAVNIPYDEVPRRAEEIRALAAHRTVVLYCRYGVVALLATDPLIAIERQLEI
jgi:rhodanese-related sulfurtransferase